MECISIGFESSVGYPITNNANGSMFSGMLYSSLIVNGLKLITQQEPTPIECASSIICVVTIAASTGAARLPSYFLTQLSFLL